MFRSDIAQDITLADVEKFNNEKYKMFDEFASQAFDIWKITFPNETSKQNEAVCNCPAYDANSMCKHVISIANSLGLLPVEEEDYDDEPLIAMGRGRPKHATKALIKE